MLRSVLRSGFSIAIACLALIAACTDRPAVEPASAVWRVADVTGAASMRTSPDAAWQPLVAAMLAPGAEVEVAPEGRLQLASAGDLVTAEGGSRFTVPESTADAVGLIQSDGRMRYEVETRPKGRFQVETPYLAITVKGTAFAVAVESGAVSVEVSHGVVQVDSYASGQSTDLRAGEAARLDAGTDSLAVRSAEPEAAFEPVTLQTGAPTRHLRPFSDAVATGKRALLGPRGVVPGLVGRSASSAGEGRSAGFGSGGGYGTSSGFSSGGGYGSGGGQSNGGSLGGSLGDIGGSLGGSLGDIGGGLGGSLGDIGGGLGGSLGDLGEGLGGGLGLGGD